LTTVDEAAELLMVDKDHFPEMIAKCQEVTAILVHVMLDRARRFTKADLHDEKLISLGRLSAGLAHELNNPASALARTAGELTARMFEMEASALALGAVQLTAQQLETISRVRTQCDDPAARAAAHAARALRPRGGGGRVAGGARPQHFVRRGSRRDRDHARAARPARQVG
jgi:C4-dicarboxylate-specific signal transduction histidine kinase